MTIVIDDSAIPPCAREPEVYQDENLHSTPRRDAMSPVEWRAFESLRAAAHRQCAACPMLVDCLYRAVVEVDVSGYAACTTEKDRARIRRELGIVLHPTATMVFGAPRVGAGPVDHEAVLQMRTAHPKDTCQQLAERLGCSTSTVKRHLRRARQGDAVAAPAVSMTAPHPTVEMVLDCFDRLESSRIA